MTEFDIAEWSNALSGAAYFGSMMGIHWLGFSWWIAIPVALILGVVVWFAADRGIRHEAQRKQTKKIREEFHRNMRGFGK